MPMLLTAARPTLHKPEAQAKENTPVARAKTGAMMLGPIVVMLFTTVPLQAHRLEADFRVLSGRRVEIESWFDLSGASPQGAKVYVYQKDGTLLTQGELNGKGLFVFSYARAESLHIVVAAGAGHRKELDIPASALVETGKALPGTPRAGPRTKELNAPSGTDPAEETTPFADRRSRVSLKDILIGIGFLLAGAAFVLGLRNAKRLQKLDRRHFP
jgi:hypothetical protein